MRTLLFAILLLAVWQPHPAPGCAVLPRNGQSVGVNAEEAIILYDSASGTEHFIRRADFRAETPDFGFLVPTPTRPSLEATNASIFFNLAATTAAKHEFSGKVNRIVRKKGTFNHVGAAASPAGPRVVEEKEVAGFHAKVLQADDVEGLKKWLEENRYDARPSVMDWLKWYVDNKWYITAFKISQKEGARQDRWMKAVRMSFKTDKPFYPYREPVEMQNAREPRSLRIFMLSDAKQDGSLGTSGWPGKAVWAGPMPEDTLQSIIGGLNMTAEQSKAMAAVKWYLTEFEDLSSPRPGTSELYFAKAKDQTELARPVIYYDRDEYVDEPDLGMMNGVGVTMVMGIGAAAIALIALLGYAVIIRKRD